MLDHKVVIEKEMMNFFIGMPHHVGRPGMPSMTPAVPVTVPGLASRPAVPITQSAASKPLFPSAVQVTFF